MLCSHDFLCLSSEKQQLLSVDDYGDTMAAVQGLLKKHDAFETDFAAHRERCADIDSAGTALVEAGNHHGDSISQRCHQLQKKLENLSSLAGRRHAKLLDNSAYLQFMWKADVVESWIADKENHMRAEEMARDLSSVQTLLTKQETFDAGKPNPSDLDCIVGLVCCIAFVVFRSQGFQARGYSEHHRVERSAGRREPRQDRVDRETPPGRERPLGAPAERVRCPQAAPEPHDGAVSPRGGPVLDVRQEGVGVQLVVRKRRGGSDGPRAMQLHRGNPCPTGRARAVPGWSINHR